MNNDSNHSNAKKPFTVAFIPARGGSKRLPRKNIMQFLGKPLLFYSIALAKNIEAIDLCVVSSEDPEIVNVAASYGTEVIKRPRELANDFSSTASVAKHTLQELRKRGLSPEVLVTLQPNCPLRPVSLVKEALDLFNLNDVDSVISVTRSIHKLGKIMDGYFVPDYEPGIRSQDMDSQYYENGLVYVSRASLVLEQEDLFGSRIRPLVTDPMFALGDIDTALDFQIAEFLFNQYRQLFEY